MQKTIMFSCAMLAISVGYAQDAQTQEDLAKAKKVAAEIQSNIQTQIFENVVTRAVDGATGTLTSGNTFVFVGGQMLNGNPVKGQPYSADAATESTQTLADGNRIVNRSSSAIYRDSEGRERREESIGKIGSWSAQGEPAKVVFISDPVAKASYTLHPDDRTAERMPAKMIVMRDGPESSTRAIQKLSAVVRDGEPGPAAISFARRGIAESASSTKTEQLAPQMIEGVMAQGTRTTAVIPAGQIGNERDVTIVNERWFSSELGVVVMSKQSDPRMGETVYKLTNINRTEPQHSLFEVPADYTVNDSGAMKDLQLREQKIRKDEQ